MWKKRLFSKKASKTTTTPTTNTTATNTTSNNNRDHHTWSWSWSWRFHTPSFRLKRLDFQLSIVDDILFKILSVFEAILLVSVLCFFFLCCGCHI